jgi:hypothetical protein
MPTYNPAPYRSDTAVSVRVDMAWNKGFEAGKAEARRLAGLVLVVQTFGYLRRKRLPIIPTVLILAVLAVYLVPAVVVSSAVATVLARREHATPRGVISGASPGNTAEGWGPF